MVNQFFTRKPCVVDGMLKSLLMMTVWNKYDFNLNHNLWSVSVVITKLLQKAYGSSGNNCIHDFIDASLLKKKILKYT